MPAKIRTQTEKNEIFYKKAKLVHGDLYDYSHDNYVDSHTPFKIWCKICNEFFLQRPHNHTNGKQGCPTCGLKNRHHPLQKSNDKFIEQAKEKWGYLNRYKYDKTIYKNKVTKLIYECEKHGLVTQYPTLHLKNGCPFCNGRGIGKHTTETFINIANKIHNNLYDYSLVKLKKINDYIDIICKKHGVFNQRANNHIHLKNGCPKCDIEKTSSHAEKDLLEYIKSIYSGEVIENDRKKLSGKEIDVYLPGKNIGFEYHGMWWHLETVVGKKYHFEKAQRALEKDIQILQIYEYEWENKKEIVKSKIRYLLGLSEKIMARKTKIKKLGVYEKEEFLEKNHIQGNDGSSFGYGLFLDNILVACMTFGTSRFNKKYDYELIRYCSILNKTVIGGASKLLLNFIKENPNKSIISYADRRWSNGNLYEKIGFKFDGFTDPSFSYFHINQKKLFNRMNFQKKNLTNMSNFSENLTEYEIMKLNGYDRIWDAGQYRYILN